MKLAQRRFCMIHHAADINMSRPCSLAEVILAACPISSLTWLYLILGVVVAPQAKRRQHNWNLTCLLTASDSRIVSSYVKPDWPNTLPKILESELVHDPSMSSIGILNERYKCIS